MVLFSIGEFRGDKFNEGSASEVLVNVKLVRVNCFRSSMDSNANDRVIG